jgi:restriction system protein
MLPLLQFAADRKEHSLREAIDGLASHFSLTDDELRQLLPSGQQAVFDNRVGWARTYLKKAGLLNDTRRSHFCITDRGIAVLAENPARIDVKFLDRFGEFQEFRSLKGTRRSATQTPERVTDSETTPEEALESAYGRASR